MFVNFQLQPIFFGASVIGPDFFLHEAHAVQHALGLAAEAVGELLGIGKAAADALDDAGLAADVVRRAAVARREAAAARRA